jgi:hypothetical protein
VTAVSALVAASVLIAHQGGWDEALLIGAPILIIIGLLWLAKRRVDAAHATSHGAASQGAASHVTESDTDRHA